MQKADSLHARVLRSPRCIELALASALLVGACAGAGAAHPGASAPAGAAPPPSTVSAAASEADAQPARSATTCPDAAISITEARSLVDRYCVSCHSPSGAAGEDADFTHDASLNARRRNIEAKLRLHIMPPPRAPQPSDAERLLLRCWAKT